MTAPIASGWSNIAGGSLTHWKTPPLHGARHNLPSMDDWLRAGMPKKRDIYEMAISQPSICA